jgi:uncharacterized cupin superfamily protein
MPKLDPDQIPVRTGSSYPAPFDQPCQGRSALRLADAAGLTQFGVNIVRLPPGTWSSQRHWHAVEDELIYLLEGEATLVEDEGATILRAGDVAAWKGGVKNGHHLRNESTADVVFLVVGGRSDADHGEYPDIDMIFNDGRYSGSGGYAHKDGTPY